MFFFYSAAACNVAVKILSPKFDRLSYRYSRALYFDAYHSKSIRKESFVIRHFRLKHVV